MTNSLLSKAQRKKLFSRYEQECGEFMRFLDRSPDNNRKPSCYLFYPDQGSSYAKLLSWKGMYNPPVEAELKSGIEKFIQGAIGKKKDVVLTFVGDTMVNVCIRRLVK